MDKVFCLYAADNNNVNNFIFTIKDAKLYVTVVTLSARDNQKLAKLLSKGLEKSVYWNEYKTKNESKNTSNDINIFSSLILLELIDYYLL